MPDDARLAARTKQLASKHSMTVQHSYGQSHTTLLTDGLLESSMIITPKR